MARVRTRVAAFIGAFVIGGGLMAETEAQIRRIAAAGDYPISSAVLADGLVFASGHVAEDANGDITGDIRQQTMRAMEHVSKALAAGGSSLDRAASMMVYLRHAGDFAA